MEARAEKFELPALDACTVPKSVELKENKVKTRYPDFNAPHPDPQVIRMFESDGAVIDHLIGWIFSRPALHIPMPLSPLAALFPKRASATLWVPYQSHSTANIKFLYTMYKCYTAYPNMVNNKAFQAKVRETKHWFETQYTLYEEELWTRVERMDSVAEFTQLVVQHTYDVVHLLEHALHGLFVATHPQPRFSQLSAAHFYTQYQDPQSVVVEPALVRDFFEKKQLIQNQRLEAWSTEAKRAYQYKNWFTLPPHSADQLMAEYFAYMKEMAQE